MRSEPSLVFRFYAAGDVWWQSEKEGRLSERSEFSVPPDCCRTSPGTPAGGGVVARAFFCLLFLAYKKSERLPGRPRLA